MIENINIGIAIIGLISASIATYVGLKQRAVKSELKSEIEEKFVLKTDYTDLKEDVKELDDRQRESEKKIDIVDDRVKAIFRQMDKQSEQISNQFDKIEKSIKESFKDFIDQNDRQNEQLRGMIKELYLIKQDKK
jgi:DNA anti-recombination protein RmuC